MHLDVRNNDLSGGLPPLPCSLQYLSVTRNQLSGPINAVEPLTSLSYLDLSYNEFTGSIPSAVFEFPLSFLLLNHNQLRGAVSVPAEVTISVVDLSHNKLQGTISPYLAGTQSLFLNNNLFVGTVPQVGNPPSNIFDINQLHEYHACSLLKDSVPFLSRE